MATTNLRHATLVAHNVTNGTTVVRVKLPDVYSAIGEYVGVANANGTPAPEGAISGDERSLIKNGVLVRLRLSYKVGTVRKVGNIVCALSKVSSAIQSLSGQEFNGGTVIQAYFPQRRRLG